MYKKVHETKQLVDYDIYRIDELYTTGFTIGSIDPVVIETDFRFGPTKPLFTGTEDEWNKLKGTVAWWNEDTSSWPLVNVICPHCGSKNTHNIRDMQKTWVRGQGDIVGMDHMECGMSINIKGQRIHYDCPGYVISRYINAPK